MRGPRPAAVADRRAALVSTLVAVRHTDGHNGHAVVEAHYGARWHLFDVHDEHQAVYRAPEDGTLLRQTCQQCHYQ